MAEQFAHNFAARGEVGASLCVQVEGVTRVDLWAGVANAKKQQPWTRDTMTVVYSCTKAATAICAHILVSEGKLDLDAPVTDYWPEFGAKGKETTTVRMFLDHTAGLPALRAPLRDDGCQDWDYMTAQLAAAEPFWEPGERVAYHMINFGWLVGELVRRSSGQSLGQFFRQRVARPLGLDFFIGLPSSELGRFAPVLAYRPTPDDPRTRFNEELMQAATIPHLSIFNNGGFAANDPGCLAAEIGGAGGVANARALAKMFAPLCLDGSLGDVRLVDRDSHKRMAEVSSATQLDGTLRVPTRFALGFMKSMDNRRRHLPGKDSVVLGSEAFGHVGAGGSLGFADPECKVSFGYAMTQMGSSILLNDRGQALVDAVYRSLGYSSCDSGVWRM